MPRALLTAFALAGLLVIPVAQAEEKLPPPTKAEYAASRKNLRTIMVGVINFTSANDDLMPNNSYTREAKPLLSWRVHILPFFDEDALWREFKRDEPWDSEHNKKLIPKMPKLYAPVRVKAKAGETFYRGFYGKGAFFGLETGGVLGLSLKQSTLSAGAENTALVFEAAEPVIWTKPDDLPYDPKKPLPKLGGLFDGVFHVGLADGSIIRCRKDYDEKELRKLIECDDNLVVDFSKLKDK